MSTTTTYTGVRIVDMPDLGAVTDASSVVGERAGSGRFGAMAFKSYVAAGAGFVPVKQYGAVGDGVVDDTASLQAALNAGGGIVVTPGTYLTDDLTISHPTTLYILPGATLKQRTGATTSRWMLNFVTGSQGSVVCGGGTLDGNRDALLTPTYTALNWLNLIFWGAINNQAGIGDITISGLTLQNFATSPLFFSNTTIPCLVEDLNLSHCGAGVTFVGCRDLTVRSIAADNCGNGLINIYQELHFHHGLHDSSVSDYLVTNYNPSTHGADPFGVAIAFQDCYTTTFSRLNATGFIGVDTSGGNQAIGVLVKGASACTFSDIRTAGYLEGQQYQTIVGCTVNGLFADGQYVVGTGSFSAGNIGIMVADGGEYITQQLSAFDVITVMTSRRNAVSDVVAIRCDEGLRIAGLSVSVTDAICNGNKQFGMRLTANFPSYAFPAQARQVCRDTTLTGVTARFNGYSGLMLAGCDTISVGSGCDFTDNGYNTSLGNNFRSGIMMTTDVSLPGGVKNISVSGDVRLGDTQSWTLAASSGASYKPGASGALNRFTVTPLDPQWLDLGQFVSFKNATGSADIIGQVVDVVGPDFVIQSGAAQTWSSTGNLTALAGTASSSGQTVTGVGTAFLSLPGPVWITSGGQWFQAVHAVSDTSLQVSPAPSPPLAAATMSYVSVAVWGDPSEVYGIYIDASVAGPVMLAKTVNVMSVSPGGSMIAPVAANNGGNTYYEAAPAVALVAHAGGGAASATQLYGVLNRIATVATAGDSVLLPPAVRGMQVVVTNGGANAANVFALAADKINDGATGGSVSVAAGTTTAFYCPELHLWYR